mmetsp:Transcript_46668/g.129892  ORF Transcript_46668/g.129892 Transcript_46668/m.129892 type:complete len:250 (+) Transcript_46668:423-1172(+)
MQITWLPEHRTALRLQAMPPMWKKGIAFRQTSAAVSCKDLAIASAPWCKFLRLNGTTLGFAVVPDVRSNKHNRSPPLSAGAVPPSGEPPAIPLVRTKVGTCPGQQTAPHSVGETPTSTTGTSPNTRSFPDVPPFPVDTATSQRNCCTAARSSSEDILESSGQATPPLSMMANSSTASSAVSCAPTTIATRLPLSSFAGAMDNWLLSAAYDKGRRPSVACSAGTSLDRSHDATPSRAFSCAAASPRGPPS